ENTISASRLYFRRSTQIFALRNLLTSRKGIRSVTRAGMNLAQTPEIRADQFGIRTMLGIAETEIKFEIVLEGRIDLETPGHKDRICSLATLTALDMAASKPVPGARIGL
ncbi:MAG: hypothetical protein AB7P49_07110, partial [Bdellovibrionales bacterium]